MTEHVVGGVAQVGLRVDPQPPLSLRSQHVVGVQVGPKQHLARGVARQLPEQLDTGSGQTGVQIRGGGLDVELVRPLLAHVPQRKKRSTARWFYPQAAEEAGDDNVLSGFGLGR